MDGVSITVYIPTKKGSVYSLLLILFGCELLSVLLTRSFIFHKVLALRKMSQLSEIIRANRTYLIDKIDCREPLGYLEERQILRRPHVDEIMAKHIKFDRNTCLLDKLLMRPDEEIEEIAKCFFEVNQPHIGRIFLGQDTRSATALRRQPDNSVDRDWFPRYERLIHPAGGERGASDTDQAPNPAGPAEIAVLSGDGRRASDSDQVSSHTSSAVVPSLSGDGRGASDVAQVATRSSSAEIPLLSGNERGACDSDQEPDRASSAPVPLLSDVEKSMLVRMESRPSWKIRSAIAVKIAITFGVSIVLILIGIALALVIWQMFSHLADNYDHHDDSGADDGDSNKYETPTPFTTPLPRFSYSLVTSPIASSKTTENSTTDPANIRKAVILNDLTTVTSTSSWRNSQQELDKVDRTNTNNMKLAFVSYVLHIAGRLICPGKFTMADHVLILACQGQINKRGESFKTFSDPGGFFRLSLRIVDGHAHPYLLIFHYCSSGHEYFQKRSSRYRMKYTVPPIEDIIDVGVINLRVIRSRLVLNYPAC